VPDHADQLEHRGAVIEVLLLPGASLIAASEDLGFGRPVPLRVLALIDTGASQTAITPDVAERLGAGVSGARFVRVPGSHEPLALPVREIQIGLPDGAGHRMVATDAIEAALGGDEAECLIGRDLLRHGVLTYDGRAGSFALEL
jgi:predicted aspartyl protease